MESLLVRPAEASYLPYDQGYVADSLTVAEKAAAGFVGYLGTAEEMRRVVNDRWDYCSLYSKNVTFYTSEGRRETKVGDHAVTMAQLGDQGWELAAVSPDTTGRDCFYFKRRKQ
jgi:hypothetical protein